MVRCQLVASTQHAICLQHNETIATNGRTSVYEFDTSAAADQLFDASGLSCLTSETLVRSKLVHSLLYGP